MFGFRTGIKKGRNTGADRTYEGWSAVHTAFRAPGRYRIHELALHFVHSSVNKPVFNPVDRLRSGAAGCVFVYTYGANIIPARSVAVQPAVAASSGPAEPGAGELSDPEQHCETARHLEQSSGIDGPNHWTESCAWHELRP